MCPCYANFPEDGDLTVIQKHNLVGKTEECDEMNPVTSVFQENDIFHLLYLLKNNDDFNDYKYSILGRYYLIICWVFPIHRGSFCVHFDKVLHIPHV